MVARLLAHRQGPAAPPTDELSWEQVEQDADRDHWLSAAEAVEYGLVDKVLESKKELPASAQEAAGDGDAKDEGDS